MWRSRTHGHLRIGPFIGSEALAAGRVAKHELRNSYYRRVPRRLRHPKLELTLARPGTCGVAVVAARGCHRWTDGVGACMARSGSTTAHRSNSLAPNARPPAGIRTFDYWLPSDEYVDRRRHARGDARSAQRSTSDAGARRRSGGATRRARQTRPDFKSTTCESLALRHQARKRSATADGQSLDRVDPAPSRRRRRGCGCCWRTRGFRGRRPRSRCSDPTAIRSTFSTWVGRT